MQDQQSRMFLGWRVHLEGYVTAIAKIGKRCGE